MPEFPNLTRAPIIEALVFFQADASASWEPRKLRAELIALWPDHTEIQEVQSVMMEFRIGDGETPPQELKQSGVEGLIFRSKTKPTVYQVRRDGFIASWLHPYQNWDAFRDDATTQWERYALQSGISNLHSIFVRFINRVEFPIENFSPEDYFTVFPKRPSGIDWQVSNFVQQVEYAIPSTNFIIQTTLTRAFDAAPNLVAFILDTEVKLRTPLSATNASPIEVLAQMRGIKNQAFFGTLTERAWQRYM